MNRPHRVVKRWPSRRLGPVGASPSRGTGQKLTKWDVVVRGASDAIRYAGHCAIGVSLHAGCHRRAALAPRQRSSFRPMMWTRANTRQSEDGYSAGPSAPAADERLSIHSDRWVWIRDTGTGESGVDRETLSAIATKTT